jgi:hypothetical protein
MRPGLLAEFTAPERMVKALRELRAAGYTYLDAFTPCPVQGVEEAIGLRRSKLPWYVLVAGLTGAGFAYGFQLWIQYDYPINLGGRPLHSALAFVPITFETGVLFAATTVWLTLLALTRLPRLWHPVFEVEGFERATIDRYWIAVGAEDGELDRERTSDQLHALGAERVVWVAEVA